MLRLLSSRYLALSFILLLLGPNISFGQEGRYNSVIDNALDNVEKGQGGADQAVDTTERDVDQELDAEITELNIDIIDGNLFRVLEAKKVEIRDLLRAIRKESGRNILVKDDVRGFITIYLRDVNFQDVLRIILDANNLAFMQEDDALWVMTAEEFEQRYGYAFGQTLSSQIVDLLHINVLNIVDLLNQVKSSSGKIIANEQNNSLVLIDSPESLESLMMLIKEMDVPIETEIFELKYVNSRDIAQSIESILTKNIGRLESDERSNSIVVTDKQSKIKEIAKLVSKLDRQDKRFAIEAKTIQIVLNDEHPRGVDWEAIVTDYQSLEFEGFAYNKELGTKGNLSLGSVSNEDYVILLEALDTVGAINTISNIKLTTAENQESEVNIKSMSVSIISDDQNDSSPLAGNEDVKFFVTPRVDEEDNIIVSLKPKALNGSSRWSAGENNQETQVLIAEDSTIVIGGMFKDVKVQYTRKIPLLGDLPLLGFAFRNQGKSNRKSEIILFLTPKLIEKE